jgi:hypothetical protein
MRCVKCDRKSKTSYIVPGLGIACPKCAATEGKKIRARHDELAAESLDQAPIEMNVGDFERWTLKLAVHAIRSLSAKERARFAKRNPLVLIPEWLALHFNETILKCMSQTEYQSRELGGYESFWSSNEYWFEKPVRFASVKRAAFEAGLLEQNPAMPG